MLTAEQITDSLLARVRNPHALGVEEIRAITRNLLDRAQQCVNAAKPGFIYGVDYTIPAGEVLLNVKDFAPGAEPGHGDLPPRCLRVTRVICQGRDLVECKWRSYDQIDRSWLLRIGSRPRMFSRLGRDFLIVYPGSNEPIAVTIYYAAQPTAFAAETTPTDLRDDRIPAVKALTEVLLLLRAQDMKGLPQAINALRSQVTWLPTAKTATTEVNP